METLLVQIFEGIAKISFHLCQFFIEYQVTTSIRGAEVWVSAPPYTKVSQFPSISRLILSPNQKIPQKSTIAPTRGSHFEFSAGLIWQNQLFSMGDNYKILSSTLGFSYPANLLKLILGSRGPKF